MDPVDSIGSAGRLAGPPELGRSLMVRPGQPVPAPWDRCERLSVSEHGFTSETGMRLRDAWQRRERLVLEADGDLPLADPVWQARWWELQPGLTLRSEVLSHLLTANAVDVREPGQPRFAPLEAAMAAGAQRAGDGDAGDVLTPGGPAWCDGGPLDVPLGDSSRGAVIPAVNLAVGSLRPLRSCGSAAELAPDQRAAVAHLGSAACIVAPAGSGKTRVLTERARYLVRDLGVAPSAATLVAFNVRARAEMQERTADLAGMQVRTLNSLALALCNGSGPFAVPTTHQRVGVIDEMGVRNRLDGLVKRRRRAMTDQMAPWLEALSASRLGLRDPADVEFDFQPDVPDFATLAPQFVEELAADGLVDFDQQIVRAIEILLVDRRARAAARRACGVLLVDEFQDLAPAHLLLIRLLAGPRADVFAVGDDDQTIYGYAGASPQWLIDFDRYFPGAARHHLSVNYRCPPPVVHAAVNLLSHNHRRINKQITPTAQPVDRPGPGGALRTAAGVDVAGALRDAVTGLINEGVRPSDIAVLARVNSTLLVPQIVLEDMGVASDAPLGRGFLERTGVAGALAWLRLAVALRHSLPGSALSAAARRPPRGISPRVIEWIGEQHSIAALHGLAGRVSDERTSAKIEELAEDINLLRQRTANEQLSTQAILEAVRDEIGLGLSLDTRLDASRRSVERSAHGDDLRALISVAHLHPDPAGFAGWLTDRLAGAAAADTARFGSDPDFELAPADAGPPPDDGNRSSRGGAETGAGRALDASSPNGGDRSGRASRVRLATVHRVKGLQWPHVIVFEASEGLMPHRLAYDLEEERRVFHVALTRCSESVNLVCGGQPSPFIAELDEFAPPPAMPPPADARGSGDGVLAGAGDAGARAGGATRGGGGDAPAQRRKPKPQPPTDPADKELFEALRVWRRDRSKADGVPPYVVSADAVLIALSTRRPSSRAELLAIPGIGPAKLESYGTELLALIAEHT